jgi:RHS repeat-associated protein
MEKVSEISGEGNYIDYGARIRDVRIGPWLSVDPFYKKFPSQSAYNYVANNPLVFLDIDGNEKDQRIIVRTENGDKVIVTKVIDKDEVKMSIQHTSNGDALYSMNIHEDLILDVRKGKEGVYSESKLSIRNSGFSALADQWQDMTGGHEAGEIKEFGFVNTGGSVGSDWVLGLSSAKNKENLDLSVLLSSAGKYGPESKGIFNKFEEVMSSLKIQKSNLGEVLGALANTIQRQYDVLERGKEIGEVGKKISDNKPKDTVCLAGCGGKYHGVSPNKIRNNKNDSIGTVTEIK